jgi:hypothetical protein
MVKWFHHIVALLLPLPVVFTHFLFRRDPVEKLWLSLNIAFTAVLILSGTVAVWLSDLKWKAWITAANLWVLASCPLLMFLFKPTAAVMAAVAFGFAGLFALSVLFGKLLTSNNFQWTFKVLFSAVAGWYAYGIYQSSSEFELAWGTGEYVGLFGQIVHLNVERWHAAGAALSHSIGATVAMIILFELALYDHTLRAKLDTELDEPLLPPKPRDGVIEAVA